MTRHADTRRSNPGMMKQGPETRFEARKPIRERALMFVRTKVLSLAAAVVAIAGMGGFMPALAQESVKIGLILPMTGGQASTGKQIDNAVKLYMQQKGDRKSTRLNSSHPSISYAVFCLKKKKKK